MCDLFYNKMKKLKIMEEYWYSLLLSNIIHITLTFLSTLLLPKFSNQNLLLRGQNFLFH